MHHVRDTDLKQGVQDAFGSGTLFQRCFRSLNPLNPKYQRVLNSKKRERGKLTELLSELKTQTNQQPQCSNTLFPWGDEEDTTGEGKEGPVLLETPLVEEASPGPRAPGVEVELERHTFMGLWGELTLTLKDMARLNTLPILGIPIS